MNIDLLLRRYFPDSEPVIEVFDDRNIFDVYKRIIGVLSCNPDAETGVLQALSYCLYEILDNTIIHSGKMYGTAITSYDSASGTIKVLVADDGKGIRGSLAENPEYIDISGSEALAECIKDSVSDGKGMGFGLYSTARLVSSCGISFEIWSGNHRLVSDGMNEEVTETDLWQGTVVYLELDSKKDVNANAVVDNRTDCESEFNELILEKDDEFDRLW